MLTNRLVKAAVALVALSSANAALAGKVPADVSSFYQQDQILQNACKPSELRRLQHEVHATAKGKRPEAAWRLTRHMLCGDDAKSHRYVLAHSRKVILDRDSSGAEGDNAAETRLPASAIKLVRMKAWDATIDGGGGNIHVMFNDGGVCVAGFDLEESRGKWWLVSTGGACD
jgi:hypothetical protein